VRGLGRYFPATFVFLLFCTGFSNTLLPKDLTYAKATVITGKGVTIPVEISDSPAKRFLGLGNRDSLRVGWGMLFVFEDLKPHSFWMKKMRFPIDIIWLHNHRIVEIAQRVPPPEGDKEPMKLKPDNPCNFVLEIEAGRAEELGLAEGQRLRYQF